MESEVSLREAGNFYIGLAVSQYFVRSWMCLLVYVLSETAVFSVGPSYLVTMQLWIGVI